MSWMKTVISWILLEVYLMKVYYYRKSVKINLWEKTLVKKPYGV